MAGLPQGYDTGSAPEGYGEDDQVDEERAEDSALKNTMDVLAEFAAGANRSVIDFVDMFPQAVNALLSLTGTDMTAPTLSQMLHDGIEIPGVEGKVSPTRGNYMEPGMARSAVSSAGEVLPIGGAGMLPVTGRNVGTLGGAAMEMLGAGTATAAKALPATAAAIAPDLTRRAGEVAAETAEAGRHIMPGQRQARTAADMPVKRQSGDEAAAGYRANPDNPEGPPITDSKAHAAMGQGFDPGFIAMLKAQDPVTKRKMLEILRTAQRGQKNMEYRHNNRPLNLVGQSLLDRINAVKRVKAQAGKDVGRTARALKGQVVDPKSAVDSFIDNLEEIGVRYDGKTGQFDFTKSDIRGLNKLQAPIKRIIKIMQDYPQGQIPDAYELHSLKRIIDEGVSYSKQKQGLGGGAERVLKRLRRDIDGLLDGHSPDYDNANKRFSESIEALDQTQSAVGRKIDFASPSAATSLGSKTRALGGNYAFRGPLIDSINNLDEVIKKYNTPAGNQMMLEGSGGSRAYLDDSLNPQIELISQIEKIIGTPATNSFLGDIEKATTRAAEAATGSYAGMMGDVAKGAWKKAKGKSEDKAIEYIIDLLEDG